MMVFGPRRKKLKMPNRLAFRQALRETITKQPLPKSVEYHLYANFMDPLLENERIALAQLLIDVLTDALANTDGVTPEAAHRLGLAFRDMEKMKDAEAAMVSERDALSARVAELDHECQASMATIAELRADFEIVRDRVVELKRERNEVILTAQSMRDEVAEVHSANIALADKLTAAERERDEWRKAAHLHVYDDTGRHIGEAGTF